MQPPPDGSLPLPPLEPAAEAVRETAREVLSREEFRRPPPSIWERIQGWIGDRIADVLERLLGGGASAWVAWLVIIVLSGLIGLFLWRTFRTVRRDPSAVEAELADPRRPAREWLAEADLHEREGRWRDALRCRYRALVAELAARGLVEEIPGRTAGEYRAEVGERLPRAAGDFASVTDLFERAWYGGRIPRRDDVDDVRSRAERVLAGTR